MSPAVDVDLTLVWAVIVALAVFMYVLLDGFDLGIGLLFPFAGGEEERDVMMNTVAPIWDGNETWLVLGGTSLLAVFPLAYALLLEAFYLPLIVMLLGLVYRGVAFEFRFRSLSSKHWWNRSFALGSAAATFAQGLVLGSFVQGVEVVDDRYGGSAFDWFNPFAIFCGMALMAGYALLGATWIVMKTEGPLEAWARSLVPRLLLAVLAAIGIASLWTPLIHAEVASRWFSLPNVLFLSPVPLLVAACAWRLRRAALRGERYAPFLLALGLFALSYLGLGISLFPYIVPPAIDIWAAAAPEASQRFLLVGTVIILPLILGYTAYSYWVFRGKVTVDAGYHH